MLETIINILYLGLKIISGVSSWIMFVFIVYFAIKTEFWKKKIYNIFIGYRKLPKAGDISQTFTVKKEWEAIAKRLTSKDEANYKLSVIEADKLLDTVLKKLTIPGETMGERLKAIPRSQLPSLDNVWQAHRLRNHLVHTTEFVLTEGKSKQAIDIYKQAFIELKVL
jgi:hypothetical protein